MGVVKEERKMIHPALSPLCHVSEVRRLLCSVRILDLICQPCFSRAFMPICRTFSPSVPPINFPIEQPLLAFDLGLMLPHMFTQ